jgi:hypothetical protein
MKNKETLEEFIKVELEGYDEIDFSTYESFIKLGAKWQQERMYSEDEVRKSLLDIVLVNPVHLKMTSNGHGEFPDGYKLTEKGVDYFIEQIKKK